MERVCVLSPTEVLRTLSFAEKLSFPLHHLLSGLIAVIPECQEVGNMDEKPSLSAWAARGRKAASLEQGCADTHWFLTWETRVPVCGFPQGPSRLPEG